MRKVWTMLRGVATRHSLADDDSLVIEDPCPSIPLLAKTAAPVENHRESRRLSAREPGELVTGMELPKPQQRSDKRR